MSEKRRFVGFATATALVFTAVAVDTRPAHAQDYGRILERGAERIAEDAVDDFGDGIQDRRRDRRRERENAREQVPAAQQRIAEAAQRACTATRLAMQELRGRELNAELIRIEGEAQRVITRQRDVLGARVVAYENASVPRLIRRCGAPSSDYSDMVALADERR